MQVSAVVMPMMPEEVSTFTSRAAKLTPTAQGHQCVVANCLEQQYGHGECLFGCLFALFFVEGVPDHLSADESQDRKGNDASILGDEIAYQLTPERTLQRA